MIYNKQDPATIQALFESIAKRYDRGNALLSFNLHKYWNQKLVQSLISLKQPDTVLDLCAGTGDIAFAFLKQSPEISKIHLLDFSQEMLTHAKAKAEVLDKKDLFSYIHADAQEIPFQSDYFSCISLAYGIRNIASPQKCLDEVFRTLQKGGTLGILELTRPKNPLLAFGHRLYLKTALPLLGKWVTANKEAYQYLCNSVQNFMDPHVLEGMMQKAGFTHTSQIPLTYGTATIFIGIKE